LLFGAGIKKGRMILDPASRLGMYGASGSGLMKRALSLELGDQDSGDNRYTTVCKVTIVKACSLGFGRGRKGDPHPLKACIRLILRWTFIKQSLLRWR
jgi:hypothetical protein